jgi:hypothetical protein
MARRPAGCVSDLSAANASAFNRVELNPATGVPIHVTEIGISMNAAPNSTAAPIEFNLKRTSTVGTGTSFTPDKVYRETVTALNTTALVENSADGTIIGNPLHRWFVPVVSGIIWVAAPGREPDAQPADFIGVQNVSALGTGINAAVYVIFEE